MLVEQNGDLATDRPIQEVGSILDRRKQLKRQRRHRFLQAFWRTSVTLGFTVSLGWGLSQPEWKIRSVDQVSIFGNTHLSTQFLERLLPISYPSSLIRIQPGAIAKQLKNYAHVDQVAVSRQLFPPQVNIVIQERSPVAITRCSKCVVTYEGLVPFKQSDLWLIDSAGVVLPLESYPEIQRTKTLPKLEIQGYFMPVDRSAVKMSVQGNPMTVSTQKQQQLRMILPNLLNSSANVKGLDWRDEKNLKLSTDLGSVHLGNTAGEAKQFKAQMESLNKLRSLPSKVDLKTVAFVDLSDPQSPALELRSPIKSKEASSSP